MTHFLYRLLYMFLLYQHTSSTCQLDFSRDEFEDEENAANQPLYIKNLAIDTKHPLIAEFEPNGFDFRINYDILYVFCPVMNKLQSYFDLYSVLICDEHGNMIIRDYMGNKLPHLDIKTCAYERVNIAEEYLIKLREKGKCDGKKSDLYEVGFYINMNAVDTFNMIIESGDSKIEKDDGGNDSHSGDAPDDPSLPAPNSADNMNQEQGQNLVNLLHASSDQSLDMNRSLHEQSEQQVVDASPVRPDSIDLNRNPPGSLQNSHNQGMDPEDEHAPNEGSERSPSPGEESQRSNVTTGPVEDQSERGTKRKFGDDNSNSPRAPPLSRHQGSSSGFTGKGIYLKDLENSLSTFTPSEKQEYERHQQLHDESVPLENSNSPRNMTNSELNLLNTGEEEPTPMDTEDENAKKERKAKLQRNLTGHSTTRTHQFKGECSRPAQLLRSESLRRSGKYLADEILKWLDDSNNIDSGYLQCDEEMPTSWSDEDIFKNKKFYYIYTVCFDKKARHTRYTYHTINPFQLYVGRKKEFTSKNKDFLHIQQEVGMFVEDPRERFTKENVAAIMKEQPITTYQQQIYDRENNHLLLQQFVPTDETITYALSRATFIYSNSFLMWHGIECAWLNIQNQVKKASIKLQKKLNVFTGIGNFENRVLNNVLLGKVDSSNWNPTLAEPSEQKSADPLNKGKAPMVETSEKTQTVDSMNSASMYTTATASLYFPHVWKVVMDDDDNGIAFVIVNDKQTGELFSELFTAYDPQAFCDENGWSVAVKNAHQGVTMCCKVEDLANLFAFPNILKLKEKENFDVLKYEKSDD